MDLYLQLALRSFRILAHRTDPSSVDVSMMLAEVYEEMGNLPQALTLVTYGKSNSCMAYSSLLGRIRGYS